MCVCIKYRFKYICVLYLYVCIVLYILCIWPPLKVSHTFHL